MNKNELARIVSKSTGLSQYKAKKSIDTMFRTMTKGLKEGDKVTIVGFGSFRVKTRSARRGRNPRTGRTILIKKQNFPSFIASPHLRKTTSSIENDPGDTDDPGPSVTSKNVIMKK